MEKPEVIPYTVYDHGDQAYAREVIINYYKDAFFTIISAAIMIIAVDANNPYWFLFGYALLIFWVFSLLRDKQAADYARIVLACRKYMKNYQTNE